MTTVGQNSRSKSRRNRAYDCLEFFWHRLSEVSGRASQYLQSRATNVDGPIVKSRVRSFRKARMRWLGPLLRETFGVQTLRDCGLCTYQLWPMRKDYPDWDTEVLVFAYFDKSSSISTLRVRDVGEGNNVRSLKSARFRWPDPPHRPHYPFCRNTAVFRGSIAIVEGELDCISMWQAGQPAMSTTSATNFCVEFLRHFDGSTLYICGDGDGGGSMLVETVGEAIGRALNKGIVADLDVYAYRFPDGTDANDQLQNQNLANLIDKMGT